MKALFVLSIMTILILCFSFSGKSDRPYNNLYATSLNRFDEQQAALQHIIAGADLSSESDIQKIRKGIEAARLQLKDVDFWLRYFEPNAYRMINGPLPVEWENEVFEKFEPPYRREGAGLSLAELYLDQKPLIKDTLLALIRRSRNAVKTFEADSITSQLNTYHHFFLANRLFLLNLAAIYTTGFECPDTSRIIPELQAMLEDSRKIYAAYNESFPATPLTAAYLGLFEKAVSFAKQQPAQFSLFDHFSFIKDYVNPLFALNQQFINQYEVRSINFNDYSLNNQAPSIFDKSLYTAQDIKGIYSMVDDEETLREIRHIGKLLFYDPILSGNNLRSCASCHKSSEYFTDTTQRTAFQFDHQQHLPRNTPTLIDAIYNHLLMLDGKHISLQAQGKDVITNPVEMGSNEKDLFRKLMSCREYREAFKKFVKLTPEEKGLSMDHITSALSFYYGSFSLFSAPFDDAMNNKARVGEDVQKGFNLFMSKAKCGTCHFVPYFNGVKPPYVSSEFEVLGTPDDTSFTRLSPDKGRFLINPAPETLDAFRTGSIRNAQYTKPYMHNGVFSSLEQVIDFYDAGGGTGKRLTVSNQTLPGDSLKLSSKEKQELMAFIRSLNEHIVFEDPPSGLPVSSDRALNQRKVGGLY
jgi:cytochrome c peroxidase